MTVVDLYQRNNIKEGLQSKILAFVYNNKDYNQLVFTGGTCLRKIFGLNRLSEDLDFDIPESMPFSIQEFADKVGEFLSVETKVAGNENTVFVKFPDNIFVRCDFSRITTKEYLIQKNLITADNRQFFVVSYDLPTLFANKVVAFLRRNFFKGKFQTIPFKGRDIYDIYWFLQLSAQTGYKLKPNSKRLVTLLGDSLQKDISKLIKEKISTVDQQFVYNDLYPLIESKEFLDQFLNSFEGTILNQIDYVLP